MTNPRRRRRLAVQKKGREASVILGKEPVRQSQELAREVVQDAIDYVEAPDVLAVRGGLLVRRWSR